MNHVFLFFYESYASNLAQTYVSNVPKGAGLIISKRKEKTLGQMQTANSLSKTRGKQPMFYGVLPASADVTVVIMILLPTDCLKYLWNNMV